MPLATDISLSTKCEGASIKASEKEESQQQTKHTKSDQTMYGHVLNGASSSIVCILHEDTLMFFNIQLLVSIPNHLTSNIDDFSFEILITILLHRITKPNICVDETKLKLRESIWKL